MLANEHEFEQLLNEATAARFVVRSKPPFSGPTVVLKYLALIPSALPSPTHGCSPSTMHGRVSFTYRDYRQGGVSKVMRLSASNFLSRFLLHVLPKAFVRIRYYGFLSRGSKANALDALSLKPSVIYRIAKKRPLNPIVASVHVVTRLRCSSWARSHPFLPSAAPQFPLLTALRRFLTLSYRRSRRPLESNMC